MDVIDKTIESLGFDGWIFIGYKEKTNITSSSVGGTAYIDFNADKIIQQAQQDPKLMHEIDLALDLCEILKREMKKGGK
jgi:hypothetical protein